MIKEKKELKLLRPIAWLVLFVLCMSVGLIDAIEQDSPKSIGESIFKENIRWDEMADLAAGKLKIVPACPLPGEKVDVQLEVRNQVRRPQKKVLVALFIGPKRIAEKSIDIGATAAAEVHLPWTVGAEGFYKLIAVVDPDRQFVELDYQDNQIALEIPVLTAPPTKADFAITDLKIVPTSQGSLVLKTTVRNNGNTAAPTPILIKTENGRVFMQRTGPIDPGSAVTIELPLTREEALGRISAEANLRRRDLEGNPKDNLLVYEPRPKIDLRILELSGYIASCEQTTNREVTISFRIENAGMEDISTPFITSLSTDPQSREALFTITTQNLPAGQTVFVSHTFPVPADKFSVRVESDTSRKISEIERANNIAVWHYENAVPNVGRWVCIGPTHIKAGGLGAVGVLGAIAIDPKSPSTIYVGSPRGSGVWKTTNGGTSWKPLTDSFPTLSVCALAVDPSSTSRVYVSNAKGLYRSENGGSTWVLVNKNVLADSSAFTPNGWAGTLLIHPTNPDILFLAASEGVCRSKDRGVTWNVVKSGGPASTIVMDPSKPDTLYASLFSNTDYKNITGIYRTTDGGSSWQKLAGAPGGLLPVINSVTTIALAHSKGTVYAVYRTSNSHVLYRSTSTTATVNGQLENKWELRCASMNNANYAENLWADPTDANYVYASGVNFGASSDGGKTFQSPTAATGPHADNHGFAFDPNSPAIIYTIGDGGIYRSSNHGAEGTWKFIGAGIANVEFYDMTHAATNAKRVIGGTQDNGSILYDGTSTVWNEFNGGDGATVDIDDKDADRLYSMNQYADSILRTEYSTDSTKIKSQKIGLSGGGYLNLNWQVLPDRLMLACAGSLWQRDDVKNSAWAKIFTPTSGSISRCETDVSIDLYYAGSDNGRLYAGLAGKNWKEVFQHPDASWISDIVIDPDHAEIVYVSFGGSGKDRIYRLQRSSATPAAMTGTTIAADLPATLTVNALAVDLMTTYTLYAGTNSGGVYRGRSTDGGSTWNWTSYNDGLPPAVKITDLEVHPTTGIMRAASYGRSVFEVYPDFPIGTQLAIEGKITSIMTQNVGAGGYGPKSDHLDAEVVARVDSAPEKFFGFQLRSGNNENVHSGMLEQLRNAYERQARVAIIYVRTGVHGGRIIRLWEIE